VGSVLIRQRDGLYSLNDLHKASGGKAKHKPVYFLSHEQTKALIEEWEKVGISTFKTDKVRNGSTYACAELLIAYAAWISPAFHMQVVRVFLDSLTPAAQTLATRTLTFTLPRHEIHRTRTRWLLDIDCRGEERCQRLSEDTHVLTRDQLVRMLIQNPADLHMSLEERLSVLAAILRGLSQAACLSARRLGIKPAQSPELITGYVSHMG